MSAAVTVRPRRLNSCATRVVPVNRSTAVVAPTRVAISPSTGTRVRFEPRYLITLRRYGRTPRSTGRRHREAAPTTSYGEPAKEVSMQSPNVDMTIEELRAVGSLKWTRHPEKIGAFIAEMD